MCRLLGIIANKQVDLRFSLLEAPNSLKEMSRRNVDGWGLGWYEGNKPRVVKEPVAAYVSKEYQRLAAQARSRIFVGHVRKATNGEPSKENCHPFSWDRWLFAHNGSIARHAMVPFLETSRRQALEGETDSEVYFHWILQNIRSRGAEEAGIKMALSEVRKHHHTGLNFILTNGSNLYAYREAATGCGYYSLYYLVRDFHPHGPAIFWSRELDALLDSKSLNKEKAVLVCSEKLTDENWAEIPLRHLLIVSGDLAPRMVEVK